MKSQRIVLVVLVSVVVLALLAACTGGSAAKPSTGGSSSGGKNFNVTATEFAFTPNEYKNVKAGQKVTFKVTNKGTVEHNFIVQTPDGSELGRLVTQPGETKTLEVTPAGAGEYPIFCDVAGHRESGMEGKMTVN